MLPASSLVTGTRASVIGTVGWVAWLAFVDPNPIESLVALAAAVVYPLVIRLAYPKASEAPALVRWASFAQLPAAGLLMLAIATPVGTTAAALAVPWLVVTALGALGALLHVARGGWRPMWRLSLDAGLGFLAIGGGWAFATRLGYAPLGFSPTIVALTAAHFHYAGFVLPVIAGRVGEALPHRGTRWAAAGVMAGVPLVAVGITASPLLELIAGWILAGSAAVVAVAQLWLARAAARRVVALLWALSSLALLNGMVLAAVYGYGEYDQAPWPSIPDMIRMHGTVNALGFALLGVWGWTLHRVGRTTSEERDG